MNGSIHPTLKPSLLLSALLGGIVLTSCASSFEQSAQLSLPTAPNPVAMPGAAEKIAADSNREKPAVAPAQMPRQRPQLIKNAEISVSVNSIEKSIEIASKIVKQQQGDLLGFQDQKPRDENARHTASMQIRVPQEQLETSLDF